MTPPLPDEREHASRLDSKFAALVATAAITMMVAIKLALLLCSSQPMTGLSRRIPRPFTVSLTVRALAGLKRANCLCGDAAASTT
jgi:hypothetical protein